MIGLALGSGSARGLAHFGVIKALKENDIHIGCVSGSSIGAIVGAAFAGDNHLGLEKAYRAMDKRSVRSLMDLVLPRSGFMEGERAVKFISEYYGNDSFEALNIPFLAIATDILTGKEVILKEGSLTQAVRASSAVPGLLTPVKWGKWVLADGGMVNPVPVSCVRALGAQKVIAVNLNHHFFSHPKKDKTPKAKLFGKKLSAKNKEKSEENSSSLDWLSKLSQPFSKLDYPALINFNKWVKEEPLPGILDVLMASVDIMETQITENRLAIDKPDLLIQPNLSHIRFLDFHKANEIINEGYLATCKALEESKQF